MTTPKEALEPLAKATESFGAFSDKRDTEEIWLWRRSSNIGGQDYGITLQDALNAKAAIPVAELHERLEERIRIVKNIGVGWIPIIEILTKLEALKCNPQK